MTYLLPKKLQQLEPYKPLSGDFPVRLDANESFLSLPDEIRQEIGRAVAAIDFHRYPDPYAAVLCKKFGAFYEIDPALVVAGNGSDELLSLLGTCFADAGDRLLVARPDFSMYEIYGQMGGMEVIARQKDSALQMDADSLIAAALEEQVKMLIFSNPCNPTGQLMAKSDVLKIVEALDCLVVVDEAYMDFAAGSVLQEVENYDNLIVLKTFSKAFGMAAARLGFAVTNRALVKALQAAKSPYNVNTLSQVAGCVLLDHPEFLRECIQSIKESRDDLYQAIKALKKEKADLYMVYPTSANFVYLQVADASAVFEAVSAKGIAIRLMKDNHLRIAAGSPKENRRVWQALSECLH